MEAEMTFLQARFRDHQIKQAGKALYLKSTRGLFNPIILPEIVDQAGPRPWVYLLRSDGQILPIRLGNE